MKSYTITVNGNVYDVTVEENGNGAPIKTAQVPRKAPTMPNVSTPNKAKSTGAGSIKIEAGAAGKVFKIEANVGDSVKSGDPIIVLEIMKMETPVVAPKDGTIKSIDVSVGQSIEAAQILATMNE